LYPTEISKFQVGRFFSTTPKSRADDVARLAAHTAGATESHGRYPPSLHRRSPPYKTPHTHPGHPPRQHPFPTPPMQMQTITLRAAPSARRLAPPPPPQASSSSFSAGRCFLPRSPHPRCRRTRSVRASASIDQEVKERADSPSPSGE
jgi:hypothetical protein